MAKKNDPKKRKELKDELDDLLKNFSATDDSVDKELSEIDEIECPIDFEELEEEHRKEAEEMTDAFLKTFVENDLIREEEYMKVKSKMDKMTLQDFLYQRKIYKLMINQMASQVMTGNVQPRMIEVVGQLQSKLETLNKTIANYALFLEETYKKANHEANQRQENALPAGEEKKDDTKKIPEKSAANTDEYYVSAGTKGMIEELPDSDISYEDEENKLTDPTKKTDLMTERGIEIKEDEEDESDLDVDEMI